MAGGGEENGVFELDLIHEREPSFGSGVLKSTLGCGGEGAGRSPSQRILNVAVERKYTAAQASPGGAIGKMTGDALAVLENMTVAIDDFHGILLWRKISPAVEMTQCPALDNFAVPLWH